jgi:hypothetical protein
MDEVRNTGSGFKRCIKRSRTLVQFISESGDAGRNEVGSDTTPGTGLAGMGESPGGENGSASLSIAGFCISVYRIMGSLQQNKNL